MKRSCSSASFSSAFVALLAVLFTAGSANAQAVSTWKAAEVWRIDGSEAGEPFADLRDFVVLKNGHMWALDFKDQNIRRYGADGKFIATTGRVGKGPGETSNANGMAVANDGSVWVNDPSNARINVYAADGKFIRQISRNAGGYGYRWDGWFNRTNGELFERPIGGAVPIWQRYNAQGIKLGSYPYTSCPSGAPGPGIYRAETKGQRSTMGPYPFSSGGGFAPDTHGNVWCAAARATRVSLIPVGKTDTIATTSIQIPNVPVTNAERTSVIAAVEKRLSTYAESNFDKSKVADSKPGIAALFVDEDGRLWVQHAATYGERTTTFDLFDGKGKHLAHIALPVKQSAALPVRARGNQLWLAVLDDDDVPGIVQFRIWK